MLRNKFVIIIVVVLLAAVAAYNYTFFSAQARLKRPPGPQQQMMRQGAHDIAGKTGIPASTAGYLAVWRRDPFLYSSGSDKSSHAGTLRPVLKPDRKGLYLEGIMTREGKGYALINGGIYGIGDKVQNATIIEIGELHAKIRTTDGIRTIRIAHDLIEKEN